MRAQLGHRFGNGELTAADCAATDCLDLPFRKLDSDDGWVWAASHASPSTPDAGQAVEWQHSRNDRATYERRVPPEQQERIDETNPKWKAVRLPRVVTVTLGLVWLVETPDPDRLMGILVEVAAVGKGHARGNGTVRSWGFEETDPFEWTADLRPFPTAGSGVVAGIRPPYHHPAQQREVAPC